MNQQLIYVATRNRLVCCNPESAESIKSANETLALSTNGDDQHTNEKQQYQDLVNSGLIQKQSKIHSA